MNLADHFLEARIREGHGPRTAIHTPTRSWRYDEIHELAGRYATVLREKGVQQEQRVVIALEDGAQYVGAFFGALKIGAVVVMVNPQLPAEGFTEICRRARAAVAVVAGHAFEGAEGPAAWLRVDKGADRRALETAKPTKTVCPTHPADPAIWLFSGGTTGAPKAVVQSHASFAYTTRRYAHGIMGYDKDDVVISVPKLYFGYATGANLLFPFSVGASAVLFPERCTVGRLFEMIERFQPTLLVNVPTMVNHMVQAPEAPSLGSLRASTSAGEALSPTLHARWRERFGVPLVDGLGTAEMWHIFLSNRPDDVRPGTLGTPVPGFEVELVDPEGAPVPPGEIGRMRVKGGARANGYWQNVEADRAAFHGPWYVSQDMMQRRPDGAFVYCGRGDDMLKVSGRWLSPREVEDQLLAHDLVQEVAVIGVANAEGLVKPWAFVRPHGAMPEDEGAAAASLQAYIKETMEPYKYPRQVRFMADLPRTHLGKINRGRLRQLALDER